MPFKREISLDTVRRLRMAHDATGRSLTDLAREEAARLGRPEDRGLIAKIRKACYNAASDARLSTGDNLTRDEALARVFAIAEEVPGAVLRVTTIEVVMPGQKSAVSSQRSAEG